MPSLTFILPHWLYWCGLVIVPLLAMFLLRRAGGEDLTGKDSLPVAYFLLVMGGFIGLHRFYLRDLKGAIFIPLFLGILFCNVEGRDARDALSKANNDRLSAEFLLERAQQAINDGKENAGKQLDASRKALDDAQAMSRQAEQDARTWHAWSRNLAIVIVILLIIDAFLLPRLFRRYQARKPEQKSEVRYVDVPCDVDYCIDVDGQRTSKQAIDVHNRFADIVDKINGFSGNFVAYWSIIAVFVYYYEVLARYVFNSPTNWAHESMFLMFGMQYLLAGGYVLRENGHVRVDVFYMHFSARRKAAVDVATSVFFFIFACTLVWTGWSFFWDSFQVLEVSFTEWAIQYWPVKFALPLGAALLLLQGLAWLVKDICLLLETRGT
jgi:TRAP-type mannitol/chloroaromatic compound transport system permease small subunit